MPGGFYLQLPGETPECWISTGRLLMPMKINQYISANINTHLIYDDKIRLMDDDGIKRPKVQFKEVFGLGFSYMF